MSDDLVKRLRDLGDHAAFEPHMHHTAADRIEELEAKLAKAVGLLEAWINVATHCTIEEGVCCCAALAERLKIVALVACLVLFGLAVGGLVAGNSLGWATCSQDTGKDVSE